MSNNQNQDRTTWAIGGCLLVGLGIDFVVLPMSGLAFIGSLVAGLGLGLVITSFLSQKT